MPQGKEKSPQDGEFLQICPREIHARSSVENHHRELEVAQGYGGRDEIEKVDRPRDPLRAGIPGHAQCLIRRVSQVPESSTVQMPLDPQRHSPTVKCSAGGARGGGHHLPPLTVPKVEKVIQVRWEGVGFRHAQKRRRWKGGELGRVADVFFGEGSVLGHVPVIKHDPRLLILDPGSRVKGSSTRSSAAFLRPRSSRRESIDVRTLPTGK